MSYFNSLSLQWKIIIIIVALLIVFYLYRKYSSRIQNLFQTKDINPEQITLPSGEVITVNTAADLPQSQKILLEGLAARLKKDIYGLNFLGFRDTEVYAEVAVLSDVEIDYIADHYKRYLTKGPSLYEDMSEENYSLFQDNEGFKNLLIKLEKTGNK